MLKTLAPMRIGGIILALTLSLVLAGCSALKLGYNTLPDLGFWWLDGYLDFNDPQRVRMREEIKQLQAWHRQQELPLVADLLGRIEQMAPGDIAPQQACAVVAEVEARANAVFDHVEPTAAALAITLSGRQLRHLERKFLSNNENFRKEYMAGAPADQQEKRFQRLLDRLETIYGTLDQRQRGVLRQGLAQSAYEPGRMLADRQRRQQDLLQTLRRINAAPRPLAEVQMQLRGWRERAERAPDPAFRAWHDELVQTGCRIFSAVHQSTTSAQREQAVRRLRAYQRDLRELAGESR